MNFCPNCGEKLSDSAKFCPNCGFDLSIIIANNHSTESENAEKGEARSAEKPDLEDHRLQSEGIYHTNLAYPKDKHICAVDGERIGRFSGNQTYPLADGYFICHDHFRKVYNGYPQKNDELPSLIEYLNLLNDPDHVPGLLPSQQNRLAQQVPMISQKSKSKWQQFKSIVEDANISNKKDEGLRCPNCHSANVEILSNSANVKKVKKSTSINLNPLHPLTIVNHHEKEVKKHSAGKLAAGFLTGGVSLVATGSHNEKSHEYHCFNCGNIWKAK